MQLVWVDGDDLLAQARSSNGWQGYGCGNAPIGKERQIAQRLLDGLDQYVPGGCMPSTSRKMKACRNVTELSVIRSVIICHPMV
jgi:hypothetical protein